MMNTPRKLLPILWIGGAALSVCIFLERSYSLLMSDNVPGAIFFGFLALAMSMVVGFALAKRIKSKRKIT